jgi:heptosyltransferase-2
MSFPEAIVDVAVADRFAEVYAHNPRVRRVWPMVASTTVDSEMDRVKLEMRESLPAARYDLVVDLQHNLQSAAFRHGLGKEEVRYPKHRWEKLAMVWLKRFPAATTPVVDRYREPLAHLPLMMDTDGPEVWLERERAQGVYAPRPQAFYVHGAHDGHARSARLRVAIAPGAHHATKRWPTSYFARLCVMLVREGAEVVLVGGLADVDICNAVVAAAGVPLERQDGASTLSQTINAIDGCDVLVTNDSGVMHLGAARRIPVVALFGSTVTELGFRPYGTRHVVVEHDVSCRPCSHIGRAHCPRKHFKCMMGISPEQVRDAIAQLV